VGVFNRGLKSFDVKQALYQSPLVTRDTPGNAVDLDVDITGVQKLWLVVDDGGNGYFCDHADWLNPRLVGPSGETNVAQIQWNSATAGWGSASVNRSVAGSPLKVVGQEYASGIGTHATSVIEYTLPAGYTRFKSRAGLDASGVTQGSGASVHFMVFTRSPFAQSPTSIKLDWEQIGIKGPRKARDLWLRRDLGTLKSLESEVPVHGCLLLKVD